MSSIRIFPLHVGTIERLKMTFGHWLEPGRKSEFPLISWYIQGADRHILVDTGGTDPTKDPGRAPYRRDGDLWIRNALNKLGVRCEDIDTVILTHLHWDHCGGIEFFPNAEVLVQKEELDFARHPFPVQAYGYVKEIAESERYTVIAGDREIVRGVKAVLVPGHTYGSQGVLVDAEETRYFISGDTVGLFECLDRNPPLVSGIYVDLRKYYDSLAKMAGLSAFVLPGHDFRVFEKECYA